MSVQPLPPSARSALARLAAEVRETFRGPLPALPSKCFYDERGSRLFDAITRLPEYYQTRTEQAILDRVAPEVMGRLRPRQVVELGAGLGGKIRALLDARGPDLRECVLLDIDASALQASADELRREYPGLVLRTLEGDFQHDLGLLGPGGGRLVLFLGSTIGNLHPPEARAFLAALAQGLGRGDALLLGLDLVKDVAELERAYNDAAGVTAAFNRNALAVVNARLGADFAPSAFDHVAFYDAQNAWIEMRLRARGPCRVRIPAAGVERRFAQGDEIRTEISCKYTRAGVERLLAGIPLEVAGWYTDPDHRFADALLRRA